MRQAQVTLNEGMKTTVKIGGHTIIFDEPFDDGGTNLGPTPMQMLVSSLGACAAITAKLYAQRKGWPLEGVDVDVTEERFKAADYPAYQGNSDILHEFRQRITFRGNLTDEQRARLLEIAGKCPVHRVLTSPAFISEELVEAASV